MNETPLLVTVAFVLTTASGACGRATKGPSHPNEGDTTEPRIQRIAHEELEQIVASWQPSRAVVVVLEASTGAVLAMDGRDQTGARPRLAAEHPWITGSTIKTFTLAAALEERTITLDQRFPCGERAYGSERLFDAQPCTETDAAGILALSSNVGTSYVFDTLGSARVRGYFERLHLGDPPGTIPQVETVILLLENCGPSGSVRMLIAFTTLP